MKIFDVYIYIMGLSIGIYVLIKCKYNITMFDKFIYIEDKNDLLSKFMYYMSHFIYYYIIGVIFSFDVTYLMLIKIILTELIFISVKDCDIMTIKNNYKLLMKSIILSFISFILGCLLREFINYMMANKK